MLHGHIAKPSPRHFYAEKETNRGSEGGSMRSKTKERQIKIRQH
jgi:hypothetical protein